MRRTELHHKNKDNQLIGWLGRVLFIALLCAFLWQATPARAQMVTGDIVGTVTDESGAVIPAPQWLSRTSAQT